MHDNSYEGVYAYGYPATATINLKIDHSRFFNNVNADIELEWVNGATITNNELFASKYGLYSGSNPVNEVVDSNSVHDNSIGGIAELGSTGTTSIQVTNNRVFNNSTATNGYGISASGSVTRVSGNIVTGQIGGGALGIYATFGAVVDGNVVSGNSAGIGVRDAGTTIKNNRVFTNTTNGIELDGYGAMVITDNRIYSNNKGIFSSFGDVASEQIIGNLIYANTGAAIDLSYRTGSQIIGNTIYQAVGTAINLANTATGTVIEDNIIWGGVGTLLNVAANSVTGLVTDYNLYYRGASGTANAAVLGATTYASLAAWQAGITAQNQHSVEGDPKFIDINGADNQLGGPDAAIGGGADDDFTPGKFSPAIDAANAFLLPSTDLFGQSRHDDPAVVDTGTGALISIGSYSETDLTSSLYANNGSVILHGWSGAPTVPVSYHLPFAFTLGGVTVQDVRLSSAGYIELDPNASFASAASPSVAALEAGIKIAPFWSNVDAVTGSDNMYVDTSKSGQVTFTWIVRKTGGAPSNSDFSATLFSDGSIRFDYGPGLSGLAAPVIGISSGPGNPFAIASINGNTNLTNAPSILFVPGNVSKVSYADIGAIEFQGSSSDTTAPTIVSGSNLPAEGASTDAAFTSVSLSFSEALDRVSALSAQNYQLVEAGADGQFGTPDDKAIAVSPSYVAGSNTLTVNLVNGALANGYYRLIASPTNGILDTAGNPLDGDGNGSAGGAFVRTFHIDRSMDHPPIVADATLATPSGTALPVTLVATSPDNNPLSFGIVTQPKHGTIQNFDPVAGTFTYLPNSGFAGSDTIGFYAQDNKLGYAAANLTLNVTAVNQPPVASAQTVAALSGRAVQIVLQGYDLETPANQLTLVITTQPTHGTLQITGQNTVTYTSNTPYSGADQFAYAWKDTGAPAGTAANAVTGAPATVSISVAAVNHPPLTQNTTVTTVENTAYVFQIADFPFSDPNDQPANTLLDVIVTSLPTAGTLTLGESSVSFGQTIAASDITAGKLVFTPGSNGVGATYATFGFAVEDNGGTANNALDTSASATMTIAVTPVNHAPTTQSATVTTLENTAYVFKATDFPFADPSDQPANALQNVIVTSLPGAGALTLAGQAVTGGRVIAASDITAGKLVFTPGSNGVGATYATFGFEVEDNGGTANGGTDTSAAATMTIAVTPVNHAPTTQSATVTTLENTAYVFKATDFPFADPSDQPANALQNVIVTSLPGAGALTLAGQAVTGGQVIAASDIKAGKLVFTPGSNGVGAAYATFGFEVEDNGGTANGGTDTSAAATMTIAVTPVNHAPTTQSATVTTLENTAYVFKATDFPFADPSDQPANALQNVIVTSLPGAGALTLAGQAVTGGQVIAASDITAGKLVFTPGSNGVGAAYATFGFEVEDNGGTANGGTDTSAAATMTIAVTPVNHAPTTQSATVTTLENTAYVFKATDFPFADPSDQPANALQNVIVTSLPGAGALTLAGQAVTGGQVIAASDITAGKLVFTPGSNGVGAAYATFGFEVEDSGGTANGGTDTSGAATMTVTINQVVDHPPTTNNIQIAAIQNTPYVFKVADFPFADPKDVPPNTFQGVVIVSLPGAGTLSLGGRNVAVGDTISTVDIAANKLTFLAAPQGTGLSYASFRFAVQDNGNAAADGSNTSAVATATINVTTIDGSIIKNTYDGSGQLVATDTIHADGSYDIRYYVPGTFGGVTYASFDISYTSANFRYLQTFYDASGNVVASETFASNGGYAIYVGGLLTQQKTVNPDGSYQIAYTGVSGAAYTGYTVQYGANGKRTSETFSNGLVETWTYNPDGSYQIAYTGVSGAAYTGYTVQYGVNGKPTSETFSNGLVETWTYNPDGSYQIAYTGVSGAAYTGYTVQYGANGKPTSATFSNGLVETWTYNPDGSYQIAYTGVSGAAYTGYTVQYGVNGKRTSETFSNGLAETWTYNPDGSYQIAYTGVSGAAYTGYTVQYGANGKPTSATFSNGLVETWTYNPDGSYQITFTGVSGAAYTGYTVQYGANGKRTSEPSVTAWWRPGPIIRTAATRLPTRA